MNEPRSYNLIPSDELLLRRAEPRAWDRGADLVKPLAFRLRTGRGERSLSLYAASMVDDPTSLLASAPEPGWGIVVVTSEALITLGFVVSLEPDERDLRNGEAHVSATPPYYTEEGQLPIDLAEAIASAARWLIRPTPPARRR